MPDAPGNAGVSQSAAPPDHRRLPGRTYNQITAISGVGSGNADGHG